MCHRQKRKLLHYNWERAEQRESVIIWKEKRKELERVETKEGMKLEG